MPSRTEQFRAVIFDMDGVIVDSEPLHERAFREVFEEIGYGQNHGIDFPAYYGQSDLIVWRDFIARHRPSQSLDELLARKEGKFAALLKREEPIYVGLPELLEKVAARYRLPLASRSRHPTLNAGRALRRLPRFFRVIVRPEGVTPGKTGPDSFLPTA